MCNKLSWNASVVKKRGKTWKLFYLLKINKSMAANTKTKVVAYVGYVMHNISYVSQA